MLPRSSPDAMMDPPGDQTTDVILRLCASGRVIRGRKDDASVAGEAVTSETTYVATGTTGGRLTLTPEDNAVIV
jgi:hypothetical protein|eukprot:4026135-Prymnesium_polylepis.2